MWHGRESDWWKGPALGLALVSSLAFFGWLLLLGVRLLHGSRRTVATVIALAGWLASAAAAVVIGGLAMLWVGGSLTTVHGPGGVTRVVTQDGFDGDVVLVYRPVSRFAYLRQSPDEGSTSLDPRRGRCSIHEQPPTSDLVLSCGDTSYQLQ